MRHVAIGYYRGWVAPIVQELDHGRYQPTFAPLERLPLDGFDLVLPLRVEHYDALRPFRCEPARFVIPDPDVVALCENKPALSHHLAKLGFTNHLPKVYDTPPAHPVVRKPRRGEFGAGCAIAAGTVVDSSADEFLQELIEGEEEFALHVLRVGRSLRYARRVRYRMSGPHEIRSASCKPVSARFEDCGDELDLFARILAALDYDGVCCINYKLREGRPMILEINPRFGASLCFDITRLLDCYWGALAEQPRG